MSAKAGQLATTRICCAKTRPVFGQTNANKTSTIFQCAFLISDFIVMLLPSTPLTAEKAVGVSADNRCPLEKNLISPLSFVFADTIIKVSELEPQAVKLAHIQSHKRRIANRLLPGAFNTGCIVKQKPRR